MQRENLNETPVNIVIWEEWFTKGNKGILGALFQGAAGWDYSLIINF